MIAKIETAVAHVVKPFRIAQLGSAIETALARSQEKVWPQGPR